MILLPSEMIGITGLRFEELRRDFDRVLQETIGRMKAKDSGSATLTLKLDISLAEDIDKTLGTHRTLPTFSHKITSAIQIKSETAGKISGKYELLYDDVEEQFYMRELPPIDGQLPFDMKED